MHCPEYTYKHGQSNWVHSYTLLQKWVICAVPLPASASEPEVRAAFRGNRWKYRARGEWEQHRPWRG